MTKEQIKSKLISILENIQNQLVSGVTPELNVTTRSKSNMVLQDEGYWALGREKTTTKTLKTKGGSKELLRLVHMIDYILEQMDAGRTSTLRECYYCALNWIDEAKFEKINESNLCLQNIEILMDTIREDLGVYPNEEGRVSGPMVVEFKTRKGTLKKVDCVKDVGTSGMLLPRSLAQMNIISIDADFVLVVETAGLHARLMEEGFDEKYRCIIVCTAGQPSRMTRKFLKLLRLEHGLRSAIFTDGDVYGIRIAASVKLGAIKSSHLSNILCVPDSVHIGLYPSQIRDYNLPTDQITRIEKDNIDLLLEEERYSEWVDELKLMKQTGKKAEQQALSYHGLDYVSNVYLPEVLKGYGFLG